MQSIHIPHTQMEYNLKGQNFRSLGHSPNAEVITVDTSNYYGTVQYSPMKLHQTALWLEALLLIYEGFINHPCPQDLQVKPMES